MKKGTRILFLFMLLLIISYPKYAEANGIGFRIEPILPETQISDVGYYHFQGTPGETVTLQARVINEREEPIEVLLQCLNAYSGHQGILYQDDSKNEGTTIENEFQFEQYAQMPSEVQLAPLESKIVDIHVEIPNLQGQLLGSIQFRIYSGTQRLTEEGAESQISMDQYSAMNYSVFVEMGEYQKQPEIQVGKPYFSPENVVIETPFENSQAILLNEISGTYEILDEDQAVVAEGTIPSFKMAPMTAFNYPYRLQGATLRSGTYTVQTNIVVDGNEQSFEETITIENSALREVEEEDLNTENSPVVETEEFPWMYVIIGTLLVIIGILVWALVRKK